jgi:hypothetical protein
MTYHSLSHIDVSITPNVCVADQAQDFLFFHDFSYNFREGHISQIKGPISIWGGFKIQELGLHMKSQISKHVPKLVNTI